MNMQGINFVLCIHFALVAVGLHRCGGEILLSPKRNASAPMITILPSPKPNTQGGFPGELSDMTVRDFNDDGLQDIIFSAGRHRGDGISYLLMNRGQGKWSDPLVVGPPWGSTGVGAVPLGKPDASGKFQVLTLLAGGLCRRFCDLGATSSCREVTARGIAVRRCYPARMYEVTVRGTAHSGFDMQGTQLVWNESTTLNDGNAADRTAMFAQFNDTQMPTAVVSGQAGVALYVPLSACSATILKACYSAEPTYTFALPQDVTANGGRLPALTFVEKQQAIIAGSGPNGRMPTGTPLGTPLSNVRIERSQHGGFAPDWPQGALKYTMGSNASLDQSFLWANDTDPNGNPFFTSSIAAADFNGDGAIDLMAVNCGIELYAAPSQPLMLYLGSRTGLPDGNTRGHAVASPGMSARVATAAHLFEDTSLPDLALGTYACQGPQNAGHLCGKLLLYANLGVPANGEGVPSFELRRVIDLDSIGPKERPGACQFSSRSIRQVLAVPDAQIWGGGANISSDNGATDRDALVIAVYGEMNDQTGCLPSYAGYGAIIRQPWLAGPSLQKFV